MQVLEGSLVALVTPMLPNGEIDYECLRNLIDWHIKEGTNGIVSVGTTGESATLNFNEHLDAIKYTINHVKNRIPVIAGTGANSTQEAIDLTEESRKLGADYALLVTPYYNKPNQKGLLEHYAAIADSVDINQILYNVPSRTSCDLIPKTVEILSNHPKIIGIKEAIDDMNRIKQLVEISLKSNDRFMVYSGDDPTFLEALKIGAHGVISVAANVVPNKISHICSSVRNGEIESAISLNQKLNNLYSLLFVESNPMPVKWAVSKMGLIKPHIRLPLVELDETFHEKTLSELNNLGLLKWD